MLSFAIGLFILAMALSAWETGGGTSSTSSTDGVFESATMKIDSGRQDELTKEEVKRLNDILGWDK